MEETQRLNYHPFGFESEDMAINFAKFQNDEASFHVDYSKLLTGEINGNEAGISLSSDLTSTWMNDFVMKGYEGIEEETVIEANAGLPDETDNENLVNGLGSAFRNWMPDDSLNKIFLNRPDVVVDSKKNDTNNGQLISDNFSLSKHFDLTKEMEACPNQQKTTMKLPSTDDLNSSVGAFYEIDRSVHKISKEQPVESTCHFGATKRPHSTSKDMGCTQTYSKRKKAKASDKLSGDELGSTNLTSSDTNKRVSQLTGVVGRGGNRNAKTKNSRGEKKLSWTFDDSSPVSSPEAEVPHVVGDEELISLETKELNKRVKFLPKSVVQEIKHRRRTLKNRGYARSCREKKMSETNTLQKSNGDLEKELAGKRLELQLMVLERNDWKSKYENLFAVCTKLGIRVEQ